MSLDEDSARVLLNAILACASQDRLMEEASANGAAQEDIDDMHKKRAFLHDRAMAAMRTALGQTTKASR